MRQGGPGAGAGRFGRHLLLTVEEIGENDFTELPMTARYWLAAAILPRHHDDPFDRMLISQAQIEGLTVVTRDSAFRDYGLDIISP